MLVISIDKGADDLRKERLAASYTGCVRHKYLNPWDGGTKITVKCPNCGSNEQVWIRNGSDLRESDIQDVTCFYCKHKLFSGLIQNPARLSACDVKPLLAEILY